MSRRWLLAAGVGAFGVLIAPAALPEARHPKRPSRVEWSDAARLKALQRAAVWRSPSLSLSEIVSRADQGPSTCRYKADDLNGTTPKFECVTEAGETLKVKYGGPEPHGEVAATTLARALGFPADDVRFVERVRCFGCPTFPFLTTRILGLVNALYLYERTVDYTEHSDLSWPAVERKHPGIAIETEQKRGWAWFELGVVDAPRAHVDALRLLAVFLAHWDNKSENQRLACLDTDERHVSMEQCSTSIAFMQDVGATFGPRKVDLESWHRTPVWADRRTCRVSMEQLPHGGGTFGSAEISEDGRRFLSERLGALKRSEIRTLVEHARFPQYDGRDAAEWVATFERKVQEITAGPPCPAR